MERINDAVASNLRQIREQRRMSLDELAAVTGVSKSMLAQIERGNANPTITTVWKIANGLKIPFTQLVTKPAQDVELVALDGIPALQEDDGRYRNYPVFPYEPSRPFELYQIELDPGASLQAAPHPEGTQEFIVVAEGAVEIAVGEHTLCADPAHAARFRADLPHAYQNRGGVLCKMTMIVSYAQQGG